MRFMGLSVCGCKVLGDLSMNPPMPFVFGLGPIFFARVLIRSIAIKVGIVIASFLALPP